MKTCRIYLLTFILFYIFPFAQRNDVSILRIYFNRAFHFKHFARMVAHILMDTDRVARYQHINLTFSNFICMLYLYSHKANKFSFVLDRITWLVMVLKIECPWHFWYSKLSFIFLSLFFRFLKSIVIIIQQGMSCIWQLIIDNSSILSTIHGNWGEKKAPRSQLLLLFLFRYFTFGWHKSII